jgi:ribosomal protein S27E
MIRFSTLALVAATMGAGFFAAGCAADSKAAPMSMAPSTQGVTCNKCAVTWVQVPTDAGKGRIIGYTSRKSMVCPDCKDAVAYFFSTGKLQHTCKTCGDSMEICEAH